MGKKSGKMKYVPKSVLDSVGEIKQAKQCTDAKAFRELLGYAQAGREMERIMQFDFKRKKKGGFF